MFLLDIGSPISGGAKKRAENHMTLSSFLSGLLHFITLQNFSLRLVFYTLGNQSEILIIQGILERNYTFFQS